MKKNVRHCGPFRHYTQSMKELTEAVNLSPTGSVMLVAAGFQIFVSIPAGDRIQVVSALAIAFGRRADKGWERTICPSPRGVDSVAQYAPCVVSQLTRFFE